MRSKINVKKLAGYAMCWTRVLYHHHRTDQYCAGSKFGL